MKVRGSNLVKRHILFFIFIEVRVRNEQVRNEVRNETNTVCNSAEQ